MRNWAVLAAVVAVTSGALRAQEEKPVPKGSARIAVTGCSKDYIFTSGGRPTEETRSSSVPAGTHLRMNGPKELIAQIRAREGVLIELTGLVKQGQFVEGGKVGPIRISPGGAGFGGSTGRGSGGLESQVYIDVEGWRAVGGECPR